LATDQFEEEHAERPDVRPFVHRFASRLFRRHVGNGPDDHPRRRRERCDGGTGRSRGPTVGLVVDRFGKTEVEDLDLAVGCHANVRGLQIAVNDAALVRGLESLGDLSADADDLVHGDRPACQPGVQSLAVDEFEGDRRDSRLS